MVEIYYKYTTNPSTRFLKTDSLDKIQDFNSVVLLRISGNESNIPNILELPKLLKNIPNSLIIINISKCNLQSLPNLPNLIEELYCDDNQISIINSLPSSLKKFSCYQNKITKI